MFLHVVPPKNLTLFSSLEDLALHTFKAGYHAALGTNSPFSIEEIVPTSTHECSGSLGSIFFVHFQVGIPVY